MSRLFAEFEMFCYVVVKRPHVVYIPTMWLVFCGILVLFVNGLSLEPDHLFYNIVQQKLEKSRSKIIIMGLVGYLAFMWWLYRKQRKRLF